MVYRTWFNLVASVIKKTNNDGDLDGARVLADNFADIFRDIDARFNREQFLKDCGLTKELTDVSD